MAITLRHKVQACNIIVCGLYSVCALQLWRAVMRCRTRQVRESSGTRRLECQSLESWSPSSSSSSSWRWPPVHHLRLVRTTTTAFATIRTLHLACTNATGFATIIRNTSALTAYVPDSKTTPVTAITDVGCCYDKSVLHVGAINQTDTAGTKYSILERDRLLNL